jgi:hypothetical protein
MGVKGRNSTTWTGFVWSRAEKQAGGCEHGNEPSGVIKCGEFVVSLRIKYLIVKD